MPLWKILNRGVLAINWCHLFERVIVAIIIWLIVAEYLSDRWPHICTACRSHNLDIISSFTTCIAWTEIELVTRRLPHVKHELLTLPDYINSSSVICGVRVSQYLFSVVWAHLFVFVPFFVRLLYFMSVLLITPFVSPNICRTEAE